MIQASATRPLGQPDVLTEDVEKLSSLLESYAPKFLRFSRDVVMAASFYQIHGVSLLYPPTNGVKVQLIALWSCSNPIPHVTGIVHKMLTVLIPIAVPRSQNKSLG